MEDKKLSISVENLAPTNGGSLAPFWFGIHNGQFQTFQVGQKASAGLEQLAEDGSPAGVTSEFTAAGQGKVQGTLLGTFGNGGPFAPQDLVRTTVSVNSKESTSRYFSYASMILPSNDKFIANADARDVQIFNNKGRFLGAEFVIGATDAWDAGTEVNDELPANTAFFGQATPNTGVTENGVVTQSRGFNPKGSGGILDADRFANADFTAPGYQFARVRIANLVEGGDGNDQLIGTSAPDDIFAGNGNNRIVGRGGNDHITSGDGNDTIRGGSGNDQITSGGGNDIITGGGGNDIIDAGGGNNHVYGGYDADIITSGAGNDIITGGGGNDIINSGTGNDRIYAGSGDNIFTLNAGEGRVRIYDYDAGDRFALGAGLTSQEAVIARIQGNNTILSSGSDVLAILQDVQTTQVNFV